jgi:radical SAM superfamily enzyme YgiQ (UPF0313 family)
LRKKCCIIAINLHIKLLKQKILLISPPFVQLNTPYPATTYLKGFLNTQGVQSFQADLGIEVILNLFSKEGLTKLFEQVENGENKLSENSRRIFSLKQAYIHTINAVIDFLQNHNPTLAHRICSRNYLPEANRFAQTDELEWAFGNMGTHDKARHLCTLYLEDIADLIIDAVAASSFDELYEALNQPDSFIDEILLQLLKEKIDETKPTVVGFSVPFPGNLYSALKCGQWLKKHYPEIKRIMGGGYPNTELRSLSDARVFEFVDYITLDDGELPLQLLINYLEGKIEQSELKRTFVLNDSMVVFIDHSTQKDISQQNAGTPDYTGLPLKKYLSVIETANPMHRLWSDGRWNKMTLAHGCYWGRCTFCDTSLDYIRRFEPNTANLLCDRMEQMIAQTGETGFHFVDEAAPPALLKSLALEIIRRKLNVTWWTNIRFEKNFTSDLCYLLKESGCIAISGGLEVASDRLLSLINKGVSVTQVAKVVDRFTQVGIMVHAYLMYGFPTETAQETIDSLEVVRQLFECGVIQSGFWHHFAMTAHSPVGLNPEKFQIRVANQNMGAFANNELECIDPKGTNHSDYSEGLRKSLFNYMHAIGFEFNLQQWFTIKTPKTTIPKNYIQQILSEEIYQPASPGARIVWIGSPFSISTHTKSKKGQTFENIELKLYSTKTNKSIVFDKDPGIWLTRVLNEISIENSNPKTFGELEKDFEATTGTDFILFWNSKNMQKLRNSGLLVL